MSIRDRRISLGWTQDALAEASGLSVRTIQRLEKGEPATLESLKCLAAVFETRVSTLMQEEEEPSGPAPEAAARQREEQAVAFVEALKGVYVHTTLFGTITLALLVLNLVISPSQLWVIYVAVAWAFGLGLHALLVFAVSVWFGPRWERRVFRRFMDHPNTG